MSNATCLPIDMFEFLRDLGDHNDRAWFNLNKERYEDSVKLPALGFIAAFGPKLSTVSPHFQAIPRAQGGSLFRIYRDTRFSKNKSPYKTNTGLHFRHEAAKDAHAPGFYVHLAPGEVFFGAGLWKPDGATARAIRELIVEDTTSWKKLMKNMRAGPLQLVGESLVRPPRGFDSDHQYIEDLKRKDFIASVALSEKEAISEDFLDQVADLCRAASPLMKFLCRAVDVPF